MKILNYHICKVLQNIELRGTPASSTIARFKSALKFTKTVSLKAHLSGTLSLIAINDITKIIPSPT